MAINRRSFFSAFAGVPLAQGTLAAPQQPPTVDFAASPRCSACHSYLIEMQLEVGEPQFVACLREGCSEYRKPLLLPAITVPTAAAPKDWLAKVEKAWKAEEREMERRQRERERLRDLEGERELRAAFRLSDRVRRLMRDSRSQT